MPIRGTNLYFVFLYKDMHIFVQQRVWAGSLMAERVAVNHQGDSSNLSLFVYCIGGKMCEYINHAPQTEDVFLKIPSDLSSSSNSYWRYTKIDKCIAPIVKAIQGGGIDMRGSCCGHGKRVGEISLQDGRIIIITSILFHEYLKLESEVSNLLVKKK